nr:formate dehydrogenase accessory sulfurtransferase FdhD [Archaeoglobus neptunius]
MAKEAKITLFAGKTPYHIMCTPENLKELAVGFLVSEGIVKSIDEIIFSYIDNDVLFVKLNGNQSSTTIRSSGCIGVYREQEKIPKVEAEAKFTMDEIKKSLEYLEIEEYVRTRGYHVASIVGKDGLLYRRYDVGRHNAVDKVIGAALLNGIRLKKTFLLISGRISRGMAMKCARAGIPLIVSKAAILDSAIDVCEKSGVSAVSFATNIAVVGDALVL